MQFLKLNVEAGKSLVVSGPALIKLINGECEVLGAPLNFNVLIKKYRQLPVTALQNSELEVNLGEGSSINEVEGDVIPNSWQALTQKILNKERIMVVGGVDSGKNAFCTLIINKLLKAKDKVAIIDVDAGQTEIGPPTTIGLGLIENPIACFSDVSTKLLYFAGDTTPSRVKNKIILGLQKMLQHPFSLNYPTIINTDGWILGEEAKSYKIDLINAASPSLIVGLGSEETLNLIFKEASKPFVILNPPRLIRRRSQEERRILREDSYRSYLKNGKILVLPINQVKVKFSSLSFEVNTLLGLLNKDEWLIGLGVLKEFKDKAMKVYTPVKKEEIKIVELSNVKINEEGKEIDKLVKEKNEFKKGFC
jgi:polynucleotide 5'-hydroxyl-kinase GRC3/NOL9